MPEQLEHIPATGPLAYARWSDTSGWRFCSCGDWHFESQEPQAEAPQPTGDADE